MRTSVAVLVVVVATVVATGVMSGVFYTFSTFVVRGIEALPAGERVTAMSAINDAAPKGMLMLPFMGAAAASAVLMVRSFLNLEQPEARWHIVGGALYLVSFLLTVGYHMPRNNALGALDLRSVDPAAAWAAYAPGWKVWNHMRTLSCIGSTLALALSLLARS